MRPDSAVPASGPRPDNAPVLSAAEIQVIGAGLAGCEAALQLGQAGFRVLLKDIKPASYTPAHTNPDFAELVCSNSLKGEDPYSNACGLLKAEMRAFGSVMLEAADATRVPAGGALAVDRDRFAAYITDKIRSSPGIRTVCEEVRSVPSGPCIICTGPLTTGPLNDDISRICGSPLHFYDASAPIVSRESIDMSKAFLGDRYGKGGDDYINCPLSKEEYYAFVHELLSAEKAELHSFEKREIFEGCMPVEVMASRGEDSLRFANFKPVGLSGPAGERHFAVLQLRRETESGEAYNLVGCQTNLKFGEQKRVFSMIPALRNAEFLRYGVMHRNTFLNSPQCLNADFSLKTDPMVFFAGQITGVEGYVESAASGILAARHLISRLTGREPSVPGDDTVMGALSRHISAETDNFQPMNANFGILRPLETPVRDRKARYHALAERSLKSIQAYLRLA
ncbi:MAG: methylenetetrahydrofolate--tRNA-(uracil(54)-C(5))-methyltransferase (FADH(2)-oxidizing) TrmFO [Clostridia bacterium]|nr:methylenetetrahydrofolate--tRNA-(uracil(54)-C(5))-methyltransferase (FADH(2)-oxidizing) TrmFO [Clostridia bacterium]